MTTGQVHVPCTHIAEEERAQALMTKEGAGKELAGGSLVLQPVVEGLVQSVHLQEGGQGQGRGGGAGERGRVFGAAARGTYIVNSIA